MCSAVQAFSPRGDSGFLGSVLLVLDAVGSLTRISVSLAVRITSAGFYIPFSHSKVNNVGVSSKV